MPQFLSQRVGTEEEFTLAHSLRVESVVAGRHSDGNVRQLATWAAVGSREENGTVHAFLTFPFVQSENPSNPIRWHHLPPWWSSILR